MGERTLGATATQESWDVAIGKNQGALIQLGYEGVSVEHVLENVDLERSLEQLKARGREHKGRIPRELEERVQSQTRDELATLLYTSGTTGVPKGVMITNDNMLFASEVAVGTRLLTREDSHLLWLPFAHSFAQIVKAAWFGSGLTMIFAESVDKLVDNAGETSPTILSAVPRVYEKAFNSVVAGGMANPGLQGALFRTAMREFELYAKAKANGQPYNSLAFTVAKKLVFPKVRDKLRKRFGGRITKFVSGGAPLAKKIAYFFDLLGFDMLEGYGLTETIAVTSVNLPGQNKLGTVGRPFPGVEVKIAEDCEILMRGRNIMRGYFGLPEATRSPAVRQGVQEAIDRVNATLPSYETIKRFTILDRDFSQETGELTPTLKVKRKLATQRFKKEIDAMYDGESVD